MPRIDPLQLLSCLKVLLASNGGIRSANEVKRLAGLMTKYSKKLVSKCIYIQILKCTNTELLGQFMGAGGWSLTHMWLNEGIRAMNWPLVQEILELLLLCPVDVQRLRSNSAPKLVKGLCKDGGNEGVRILATKLVEQWLKVVKGESTTTPESVQQSAVTSTSSTEIKESESKKSTIFVNSTANMPPEATSVKSENNDIEQDPLALPEIANNDPLHVSTSPSTKSTASTTTATTKNADSALVYKIVLKDGKQVLAKIENSPSAIALDNNKPDSLNNSNPDENKETDEKTVEDKLISDKISNKENEKDKDKSKESESKSNLENKETNETTDNKSRSNSSSGSSSKDKDKHRDHKSSSSSHRSSSSSSKSRTSGGSSSSSKSKSSHRNSTESSSSKNRDKDSSSTSSKDRDSDRHKSSSSSNKTSGSSSSSKDKDKHRDKHRISSSDKDKIREKGKEKEKTNQAEKDKDTLSKLTPPSINKLGKIPRKPKDDSAAPVTSITIPSKKASMSIEIRKDSENRPKTVKTYKSQFRSHGLSEEAPPPPSRKGLKKPPTLSLPGTSIPTSLTGLNLKRSSPPPPPSLSGSQLSADGGSSPTKESSSQPVEKKVKLDLTSTAGTEKVGAIKLIAAKPKPSLLVESDMFMDALSASAHPKKDSRKRRRRSSGSKEPGKDGANSPPESPNTTNSTSSSSSSSKVAPLKFYQDTLEDEEKAESNEESREDERKDDEKREDEDDIPLKRVKEEIDEKVRQEKQEEERLTRETESPEEQVKKPPGPGCGPNGPPGVLMLHRRKGPKKKLKWRVQEELEEVRFFELDETERVNVTKTFTDMKQMERSNEREAFLMARKLNCEDIMCEQTAWMPLIMVDDVPSHPEGSQSKEKKIQSEREQTTLKALYFTRHMIPDSGSEPDMEQYQITEPAVIPLDDITGNPDAVNDFTNMPWPDPKGSPPPGSDDFMQQDSPFPSGPFNPFMPFNQNMWQMGPPNPGAQPNGVIQPNMMGNFNNMNMPQQNMPPNLLSFPPPDDMHVKMNMMQPPFVGPPPNFGGGPMNNPGPGFNNFGPPGLNMNSNMKMNMNNNGPPRGVMPPSGMGRGGGWRSGGPPNNNTSGGGGGGGGNWRSQGPPASGPPRNNWVHGSSNRICKQFQRGFCRNGNKCNYVHPPNNNF